MLNSYEHSEYLKQDLIKNDSAVKQDSKEQVLKSLINLLRSVPIEEREDKAQLLASSHSKTTWVKRVLLDSHFREYLIDLLEYEGFAQMPLSTLTSWDTAATRVSNQL